MPARVAARVFAVLLALAGVFPLANLLTGGRAVPWWELAVREWLLRGTVVTALAALLALVFRDRVDVFALRVRSGLLRPAPRTFAIAVSMAAALLALCFTWYCFAGYPFTSDEMAQQWHARILLNGRLSAVAEPMSAFFNTAPVAEWDGRWFSQYPVGGPAFIAAGLAMGAPWIVNPLLIALATWQLYRFTAVAFDETMARVTTVLLLVSPMVLIMAASQMNHVPALALTLVALRALAVWDGGTNSRALARSAMVIGVAVGLVATVRPLDAVVVALAVAIFQLARTWGDRERWASLGVQALAGAVPLALLLWANARTTGSPLLFAYDALNGPGHSIGFHVDPNGVMHTPTRGLAYASGYLMRLSRFMLEWPLPGMLFVVGGLWVIRRPTRWDGLFMLLAAGFLLAYAAYWFDGFFSGPRFLFTAAPAFLYFVARAILAGASGPIVPVRRTLVLLVPLCVATAWAWPDGVSNVQTTAGLYHDQRTKLKTDIREQVARAGLSNALVFVNEGWRGRLLARLRVLGASAFRAERIVNAMDACALGDALDDVDRLGHLPPRARLDLVVQRARSHGPAQRVAELPADRAVSIVPGSVPSATCFAEFQRDSAGVMPYPPFLPLHALDADGRITGNVVFARDLGATNEQLRARFPGRQWYRYRPASSLGDTANAFVPYGEDAPAP